MNEIGVFLFNNMDNNDDDNIKSDNGMLLCVEYSDSDQTNSQRQAANFVTTIKCIIKFTMIEKSRLENADKSVQLHPFCESAIYANK